MKQCYLLNRVVDRCNSIEVVGMFADLNHVNTYIIECYQNFKNDRNVIDQMSEPEITIIDNSTNRYIHVCADPVNFEEVYVLNKIITKDDLLNDQFSNTIFDSQFTWMQLD